MTSIEKKGAPASPDTTSTAPERQILMPTPSVEGTTTDPTVYTKVLGLTLERTKVADFDAGLKVLGWKSRAAWVAACMDTVIEQTATDRAASATA